MSSMRTTGPSAPMPKPVAEVHKKVADRGAEGGGGERQGAQREQGAKDGGEVRAGGAKGKASSAPAPASAAKSRGADAGPAVSGASAKGETKTKPQGLASAAVQAGSGDVLVMSRPVADEAPGDTGVSEGDGDDGGGDDDDGVGGGGGGSNRGVRSLARKAVRAVRRRKGGGDSDGGGGGDDFKVKGSDKGKGTGKSGGGSSGRSQDQKSTRAEKGKKGKRGARGHGRVDRSEGRDRNEAVEQVSVLVGQDESGGDPVEQALNAKKKILGDDEHKNAFTSQFVDDFDPTMIPRQVERLGSIRSAIHMVRLTDHWEESGFDRSTIISKAADKLCGYARTDQLKKTLGEMDSAPIKQVYPLEVMLHILDTTPAILQRVRRGEVLVNRETLARGEGVQAEQEFLVEYPDDYKIKSFALLGGGQPGYEFTPHKNGVYRMIVDSPGEWTFALSAERRGETLVDTFTVRVADEHGHVPSAEELAAQALAEAADLAAAEAAVGDEAGEAAADEDAGGAQNDVEQGEAHEPAQTEQERGGSGTDPVSQPMPPAPKS